jgi:uncharacterized protein (TIGR03435 family)
MAQTTATQRRSGCAAWLLTAGCLFLAPTGAPAQSAAPAGSAAPPSTDASAALPAFEVVSIKPDKSGSMNSRIMATPDGVSVEGVPGLMLLREAFGVSSDRLVGAPGWLGSDRFDIEAKVAPEDVPKLKALKPTDRWAMFLPVFEDRFGLKFHHESRNLTQYVLVVSKSGLKMKEAAPGDTYPNGIHPPSGGNGGGMMRMQPGELIAQSVPIQLLVRQLSFQLGSTVVDQTGLTGKYDFDLKWTPDVGTGMPAGPPEGGDPGAGNPTTSDNAGPSIFTALEEQLGLKLEAKKVPADVIVIDHVEQPSPN